jgi:hypothetical protein
LLWALLPWSVLFIVALFYQDKTNHKQWIIWGSALLTFTLFSLSNFQLPHYIVILLPHFSILCAQGLSRITQTTCLKWLKNCQLFLFSASIGVIIFLVCFMGIKNIFITVLAVTAGIAILIFGIRKSYEQKIILSGYAFAVAFYLFMNLSFYPLLLTYQAGSMAAADMNQWTKEATIGMFHYNTAFRFNLKNKVTFAPSSQEMETFLQQPNAIAFVSQSELHKIKHLYPQVSILKEYPDFPVTRLKPIFLNKKSRASCLTNYYLIGMNHAIPPP